MFTKTKSSETPDLFFIKHLIEILLDEQRHQRADLSTIKRQLHSILEISLKSQSLDFYTKDKEHIPEDDDGLSNTEGIE